MQWCSSFRPLIDAFVFVCPNLFVLQRSQSAYNKTAEARAGIVKALLGKGALLDAKDDEASAVETHFALGNKPDIAGCKNFNFEYDFVQSPT